MQMRIAKATQEGDYRRVKALQRSLTRSFSARALAVRRVTENQGKRTAGVDRELWDTPACKWSAVDQLKQQRGYRPAPLRRVYIPKANGKERPLGIPTMRDRAMQALHLLGLEPVVESQSDPNSYGFRRNRSTADAMSQLFICLARKASAPWVLEADIEGCFDHINHAWLVQHARMDKRIVHQWLKSGVVYKGQLTATEAGHAARRHHLANPGERGTERTGDWNCWRTSVWRWASESREAQGQCGPVRRRLRDHRDVERLPGDASPAVGGSIPRTTRAATVAGEDASHTHRQGFDFLGWNFRKYSGTLLIKPSKKNVQAFYGKVKEIVVSHKTVKQAELIQLLNPVLRGWAQVPPAGGREGDVQQTRLAAVVAVDALGTSEASEEKSDLVLPEVLEAFGRPH
jgi:RNA-directed DNA polymerase